MRPEYTTMNQSQSGTLWSGNIRTQQQRRNSELRHPQKIMFSIFWDKRGVILEDFLE
jgi:hypothetical protein